MTLTREVPQTTLRPSVVQVIDTQTEEGIEQAREQLKAEAPQPTLTVKPRVFRTASAI